ncbi:mesothelin isoform X2 [Pseudophryne corroboree]
MIPGTQENVFTFFIKPYLNKKGRDCSQNVSSSALIALDYGKFSQFADYSNFVALNGNFSALDVLPVLTIQQKVNFSLSSNASNDPVTASMFVASLQNTSDLFNFLTYLNTAVISKNISSVNAPLSQALLNKTFEAIKSNISMFNSSDWTQLFQNTLPSILSEISPDQLSLVPQNISCSSYQAILKALDMNFPKMSPERQKSVYKVLIKPYLSKKGPNCSQNVNSSALLSQNLGKFSQFAYYSDFVAFNGNFSALDVLPVLTVPQIVDYSLVADIGPPAASSIVGTLQNATDVYNFLTYINNVVTLDNGISVSPLLSQALLTQTFQVIKPNFSSFNSSDWAQLFQNNLSPVLSEITPDQLSLIPKNISCDSYQAIIKGLDSNFSSMAPANQKNIYQSFIKSYLTMKGNTIKCFNQSNDNSSAWLVTNMASFMTYTSAEDLPIFANYSMLQIFASDPSTVQLASQLNFPQDTAVYYTYLLTSSGNTNVSSLPSKFLCYLSPSALKNLNSSDVLTVTKLINKQCFTAPPGKAPTSPTPEELQLSVSLVSKLNNISADTIISLGPLAVGLSPSQINSLSSQDLVSAVPALGNVTSWSNGQARGIMSKLLQNNYQIKSLESLGSLVSGLPSKQLLGLDPRSILNATKNVLFANTLSSAPPALQNTFVKQIAAVDSTPSNLVRNVPGNLAAFIPKSSLFFNSEKPVLQDVNGKSWSADQASMFFDDLVSSTTNYSQLSSSVLQGFTCGSSLGKEQIRMLAKVMKTQNAALGESQLICLTRQATKDGYPTDLDQYPKEVFLFLNASTYSAGSCVDFFTNVGMANVSVLPQGSKQRADLLAQSLSCMNVTGFSLTDSNIQVLGQLACDLNSSYIESSSGNLLTQLSQCDSFTPDQQSSIQKVISSGNSAFGATSTWTKSTLNSLGGISGFLNKDTLGNISSVSFNAWMTDAIEKNVLTRTQFASIVKKVAPTRARRAAGCPNGMKITADNVNNPLLPLLYSTADLDACLDNATLTNYLEVLGNDPFTDEQLAVLKMRLDQLYPGGYPETVISNLGAIMFLCGPTDISKWNISSLDTLGSLFAVGPTSSLAQLYIAKYISSGNPLNGSALNIIGSNYICLLNSTQLGLITPSALSEAKALDVSACNQTVKNSLYAIANVSYQPVRNQTAAYYNLIKPYLGGAPTADLKSLAAQNPNMDIVTFESLNLSAVLGLSVSDVKALLGNNRGDLVSQQTNPVVSAWIKAQKQSDLDTLGLGLQGGIRDYSITTLSSSTATTATTSPPSSSAPAFPESFSLILAVIAGILLS